MTRKIGLLFALVATLALAACAPEGPDVEPALDDTEWVLEDLGQPGNLRPALEDSVVTLTFSGDTHATGNAGCNGWGASCSISRSGAITFAEIIHTEMYCMEPGIMEQEQFFLDALLGAERYEVVDDKLHITGSNGTLVLSRT